MYGAPGGSAPDKAKEFTVSNQGSTPGEQSSPRRSRDAESSHESNAAPRAKKPYAKPAVLSKEPLEAVATVCNPPGKADPFACPSGPIQS